MNAIFVTAESAVNDASGGVQVYTRELLRVLNHANLKLTIVKHGPDMRLPVRFRRRLFSKPYDFRVPPDVCANTLAAQEATDSTLILLNGVDLAALAESIVTTSRQKDTKIILFSYGLKSVDFLHARRAKGQLNARSARALGEMIFAEALQRPFIDHVFCLSEDEAEIERWLGARQVQWLPRTVEQQNALNWQPSGNRLGCVSTLDHPPNREGLELFLREFEGLSIPQMPRFRLVGGPRSAGDELAARFRAVDYLGPLDDAALRAEAATWNAFVHPLFCYACGCSTKLAVALSWQLPIVTTPPGVRGYSWREGQIPMAESPEALARLSVTMMQEAIGLETRQAVQKVVATSPTVEQIAAQVRAVIVNE